MCSIWNPRGKYNWIIFGVMFFISVLTIISQLFLFFYDWDNKKSTLYQYEYTYRYESMPCTFIKITFLIFIKMIYIIYLFVMSMWIFIPSIIDTDSGNNNVFPKKPCHLNCTIICYFTLDSSCPKINITVLMSYSNVTAKSQFISI